MSTPDNTESAGQREAEERRKRRRLIGWLGRANDASDWYQIISSFIASKTGAATVSLGIGAAAIAGVAVIKPELIRSWLPGSTVEVRTQRWSDSSVVFPIEGVDKSGRRAGFDVVLLTKQYTWAWGSDASLAKETRTLSQDEVLGDILSGDLKAGLSRSSEVIAVGVASEEGASSTEATRARRRAETSARWLKQILPASASVSLLNLGQYKSGCGASEHPDSSWQRPYMMIGVREQDQGVNLAEALADALTDKSNMPGPACYSKFEMTRRG